MSQKREEDTDMYQHLAVFYAKSSCTIARKNGEVSIDVHRHLVGLPI